MLDAQRRLVLSVLLFGGFIRIFCSRQLLVLKERIGSAGRSGGDRRRGRFVSHAGGRKGEQVEGGTGTASTPTV